LHFFLQYHYLVCTREFHWKGNQMEEPVLNDTPALESQPLAPDTPMEERKPSKKRGRPRGSSKATKARAVRKPRPTKKAAEKTIVRHRGRKKSTTNQSKSFSFEDRTRRKLERAIVRDLTPVGAMEKALAEMIAVSIWRLQKMKRTEYDATQIQVMALFEAQMESSFYRALEELSKLQGARK
jgi:hypothetical protein